MLFINIFLQLDGNKTKEKGGNHYVEYIELGEGIVLFQPTIFGRM